MRNFINILIILALVMTTSFAPLTAYAMPHHGAKADQAQASGHEDCHHHTAAKSAAAKTAQNDKDSSGHCCDKGACKCVGGNCHSLSQYLGNSSNLLSAVSSGSAVFAFDNQFVDSALPNRLKRPPKA